jgi:hypothetical protein
MLFENEDWGGGGGEDKEADRRERNVMSVELGSSWDAPGGIYGILLD